MSRSSSRVGRNRSLSRSRSLYIRSNSKLGNQSRSRTSSKPGSPTFSKNPLLQLGESLDMLDVNKNTLDEKVNKIRDLEESVRCQEELMGLLKEKLIEGPGNGENHTEK